jgi:uncharacterized membrane protein
VRFISTIALLLCACGGGGDEEGTFTQSICPTTDAPTYDNFGRMFMESYCTKCHDSAKTGAMREDAPPTIDFDTRVLLRMWTSQIDKQAAFGPAGMNRIMPPSGNPKPQDAERTRLGEYIACEVSP